MRSDEPVQTVRVGTPEKEVEIRIFDTIPEEVLKKRYLGEFELDGVIYQVRGPFSTSCQVEVAHILEGVTQGKVAEQFYKVRTFPPVPPFQYREVEDEEEEVFEPCVAIV